MLGAKIKTVPGQPGWVVSLSLGLFCLAGGFSRYLIDEEIAISSSIRYLVIPQQYLLGTLKPFSGTASPWSSLVTPSS